jgi:hypothetical protein
MTDKKEFVANSLQTAIHNAAEAFNIPEEKLKYRIITEKTKYFGHKQREIFIEAWSSDGGDQKGLEDFVKLLVESMQLDLQFTFESNADFLRVNFAGEDYKLMLYQNGNLLNAVQYLLNRLFADPIGKKIFCECENYRKGSGVEHPGPSSCPPDPPQRPGRRIAGTESVRTADHPHDHQQIRGSGIQKRGGQLSEGNNHQKKAAWMTGRS